MENGEFPLSLLVISWFGTKLFQFHFGAIRKNPVV